MNTWKNVTGFFSEDDRHFKNTYMEISEVYDEKIEVSLFSTTDGLHEIYFSFDIMFGIIYIEREKADSERQVVKNELLEEYQKHNEPTSEFIKMFCEKHKVCIPNDIFFDDSSLLDF